MYDSRIIHNFPYPGPRRHESYHDYLKRFNEIPFYKRSKKSYEFWMKFFYPYSQFRVKHDSSFFFTNLDFDKIYFQCWSVDDIDYVLMHEMAHIIECTDQELIKALKGTKILNIDVGSKREWKVDRISHKLEDIFQGQEDLELEKEWHRKAEIINNWLLN